MNREFVLLMEFSQCKEEWNTAPMENGTQSVTIGGVVMKLELSAVSWDMKVKVKSVGRRNITVHTGPISVNADARAECCATFGQGSQQQPIFESHFHCNGQEGNISQCLTQSIAIGSCSHREDAGVICSKCPHIFVKSHFSHTIGCDKNTYPCHGTSLENPVCITELQFCDGIPDCPQGSDEPDDCTQGYPLEQGCTSSHPLPKLLQSAPIMERYDSLVEMPLIEMKEELKSAIEDDGEVSVIIRGTTMMLLWCASNWVLEP